jgi:hypothetical protein
MVVAKMSELTLYLGLLMVLAFVVNIIVQMTKGFIPLPTKLWCIIVSAAVNIFALIGASSKGKIELSVLTVIFAIVGAFIVSYVAMYGFDTFKDLWERFKNGENINKE